MRLGVRAHDCAKAPFEQRIKNIHDLGFTATQLALKKVVTEFPVDRLAMTPGMAYYVKDLFAQNKVDIAVLGCYLNLANPDEEILKEIIKTYEAHIRFASVLGCGMVGTETGAVNLEYVYEPENHTDKALDIFIKNLAKVVEYAEKMGVIFGIEPVVNHIMNDIERTKKVLDVIDSPNLQVIFDPVNLLSAENYTRQHDIIKGAYQLFGDKIAVVHAKDFEIKGNTRTSIAAGTGGLDYDFLMKEVVIKKPHIHVLLENSVPETVLETKAFMEAKYLKALNS
jgi:Sugar phosphate isomerases/epimerases